MSQAFLLRSFSGLVIATALFMQPLTAQQPGGATAGGAPSPGGGTTTPTNPGSTPTVPSTPGRVPTNDPRNSNTNNPFPEMMQRPIFLSGKVIMEDGTPPPDSVVIERVCSGGNARPEAYTDSKGRFSFQLGQNNQIFADASVASDSRMGIPGTSQGSNRPGQSTGLGERDLAGCDLRASLPGFRSEVVNLTGRRVMDNPDVGSIVLHRLGKVDGFTFSGTSAFAPKDAQKAFNKGKDLEKKKKLPEAEAEFKKAVEIYPKYAAGWYELGLVYQQQKKIDEAKQAYDSSLKADSKFVTPYAQLTRLAVAQANWEGAADYSGKLLKLNPYFSPEIYFYSAVANLNMRNLDQAEEHAREALKMDSQHRNPKISHVLGVILAQKQDYPGAVENLSTYLKFAPNASDAAVVKKQIIDAQGLASGGEKKSEDGEKAP